MENTGANALHQHELRLRNRGMASLNELGLLNDHYDSIDLTGNSLTQFCHVPSVCKSLDRVSTLILSNNAINSVSSDIYQKLPNLHSVSLANNQIDDWKSLQFVAKLPKLKHLVLLGNPIAQGDYRERLRELQPNLKYIDFRIVKHAKPLKISKSNEAEVADLLRKLDSVTSMAEVERIELRLAELAP